MNTTIILWIIVAAAFSVAAMLTRQFCNPRSRFHLLDHPNERSLHSSPIPRSGGVAILAGIVSAAIAGAILGFPGDRLLSWFVLATAIVAILSFVDDRQGLGPSVRIAGHLIGSTLLLMGGLDMQSQVLPVVDWSPPIWLTGIVLVLYLVWMVNLYNFMDGMDGLAGGMAVIGFGTFAWLGNQAEHQVFTAACLVTAAASGGFLVTNFPPARIFMGDTGSSTLGLLAGGFGLWGVRDGVFLFWVPILVFSPFIIDASVTLLARLFRGERVWEAHKRHYYQRLVQSGWSHRKTVLCEYGLMAACAASALAAQKFPPVGQGLLLMGWGIVYLGLMVAISGMENRTKRTT